MNTTEIVLSNTSRIKSKKIGLIAIPSGFSFLFLLILLSGSTLSLSIILPLPFVGVGAVVWYYAILHSPLEVRLYEDKVQLIFSNKDRVIRWSEIKELKEFGVIHLNDGKKITLADTEEKIMQTLINHFEKHRTS